MLIVSDRGRVIRVPSEVPHLKAELKHVTQAPPSQPACSMTRWPSSSSAWRPGAAHPLQRWSCAAPSRPWSAASSSRMTARCPRKAGRAHRCPRNGWRSRAPGQQRARGVGGDGVSVRMVRVPVVRSDARTAALPCCHSGGMPSNPSGRGALSFADGLTPMPSGAQSAARFHRATWRRACLRSRWLCACLMARRWPARRAQAAGAIPERRRVHRRRAAVCVPIMGLPLGEPSLQMPQTGCMG